MENQGRAWISEKVFDLAVWFLIATIGLVAAYVCFGILTSAAEGKYQAYSIGGAIAGAIVSWGVLTSVYLQLRGSSTELEDLRERNEQLQNKLIRGAPRPQGFETEVDERQRIVLARPKLWRPKGGTIFELELPNDAMRAGDSFPARFHCFCMPIEKSDGSTRESYYERELKELRQALEGQVVSSYTSEKVRVGGGQSAVECLKVIVHQFAEVRTGPSPETGKIQRNWSLVNRSDFVGQLHGIAPSILVIGKVEEVTIFGWGIRRAANCYVNKEKREWRFVDPSTIAVSLKPDDVKTETTLEFVFENPDTAGIRSNALVIQVVRRSSSGTAVEDAVPLGAHAVRVSEATNAEASEGSETAPQQPVVVVATTENPAAVSTPAEPQVTYQEVARMRVVCFHEALETVYYFDFWDDVKDFVESSAVFNQVLASARFLD